MATTKDRILDVTVELFRRFGYNGTGLKQIVADANAPFGSLYHFFPGGKEQLGEEVVRRSGHMYEELVAAVWAAGADPIAGVSDVFSGAAAVLRETDFIDLCPIATVALEMSSTSEALRQATADVFESWISRAVTFLVQAGVAAADARGLALGLIALLQGSFVLSRALQSTEPVEEAGSLAAASVRAAVPSSSTRSSGARSPRARSARRRTTA